jgi:hypothetical protein
MFSWNHKLFKTNKQKKMDRVVKGHFGLLTELDEEELDIKRSYYRFCCLPHKPNIFAFVSAIFSLCLLMIWTFAIKQHTDNCNQWITEGNVTRRPIECMGSMVVEGTFLTCIGVNLMFFITFFELINYRHSAIERPLPKLIVFQSYLYHALLPNTFIAAAVYDWFIKGTPAGSDAYYGVAVAPALFMAIWGVFGTYEMQFKNIMFSQAVLNCYVVFALILNTAGVYIYPKFDGKTDTGHLMGLCIGSGVIHFAFILIHKLIKVRYGHIQLWVRPVVDDTSVVDGT